MRDHLFIAIYSEWESERNEKEEISLYFLINKSFENSENDLLLLEKNK